MKNECIWKCQNGKIVFKVVKVTDQRFRDGVSYRVYVDRRWWNHFAYEKCENAIRSAVYVSLLGNYEVAIAKKL